MNRPGLHVMRSTVTAMALNDRSPEVVTIAELLRLQRALIGDLSRSDGSDAAHLLNALRLTVGLLEYHLGLSAGEPSGAPA